MAEERATSTQESGSGQRQGTGNGSDSRKTALRAAAIAAASGATAIAAKKAFSDRHESKPSKQQNGDSAGGESLLGGMLGSGWHAAKDSLVPFAEDAARAAGDYLGRSGPEFVRETVVPAFIAGFEGAQKSAGKEQ